MTELARHNLVRARERLHARPPRSHALAALWSALPAEPEVLRLSPHRTVLRLPSESSPDRRDWLLKLYHPRRRGELLRRLVSIPPALRELAGHRALGLLGGAAEQLAADFGLFARPWLPRCPAGDWGAELARLHRAGWSDPDLCLEDLLWTANGELVPLDLGHARFTPGGAPPLARRADLAAVAAELPPEEAEPLLARACHLAGWDEACAAELLHRGRQDLARHRWVRSARCWRDCSDFVRVAAGCLRRGFQPPPGQGQVLKRGRRGEVVRFGQAVRKRYLRPGPLGSLRRRLPAASPAARSLRRLHLLELTGFEAARPLAWLGDCLWTSAVDLPVATLADLPQLAGYLRRLHAAGHGLRDAKLANFAIGAGGPVLLDADGLTPGHLRPHRDLGRLAAEAPAGSAAEAECLRAYGPHRLEAVSAWAARFRRVLRAAGASC